MNQLCDRKDGWGPESTMAGQVRFMVACAGMMEVEEGHIHYG